MHKTKQANFNGQGYEMTIGIFDSGIGGLSVLHEAYHRLPDEKYIFYADEKHVPYGLKSSDEIIGYSDEIVNFLKERNADLILIACNTATSVAVKRMREKYDIPIVGMEPAVKPAVERVEGKKTGAAQEGKNISGDLISDDRIGRDRILVIATPVTLREAKLKELIKRVDENHRVDLLPMPRLVEFAESEKFSGPEVDAYLKEQFADYEGDRYSALVLGCTHFNYFKKEYKKYLGDDTALIDGNYGTVKRIARMLELPLSEADKPIHFRDTAEMCSYGGGTDYYISGERVWDEKTLSYFMRMHEKLEEVMFIP